MTPPTFDLTTETHRGGHGRNLADRLATVHLHKRTRKGIELPCNTFVGTLHGQSAKEVVDRVKREFTGLFSLELTGTYYIAATLKNSDTEEACEKIAY